MARKRPSNWGAFIGCKNSTVGHWPVISKRWVSPWPLRCFRFLPADQGQNPTIGVVIEEHAYWVCANLGATTSTKEVVSRNDLPECPNQQDCRTGMTAKRAAIGKKHRETRLTQHDTKRKPRKYVAHVHLQGHFVRLGVFGDLPKRHLIPSKSI